MNDTQIKQEDEMYCINCGKLINKNAVFCINCGVQIKELKTSQVQMSPSPKSKVVAIILAVLLGLWSWLYTYKKDYKKFWIFLGLFLFVMTLDLISYWHSLQYYHLGNELTNSQGWQWTLYFISFSAWIWALCNSIIRPENFYTNYPNG